MTKKKRFWEKGYSNNLAWAMGGPSLEVYELEQKLHRGANVLDLGCGDGRNSVFLALKGHKVTALEISSSAVNKLRLLSETHALNIDVIEGAIENFEPSHCYDLVLAHSSLHFVERKIWKPLVDKLRSLTNDGGFHNFTSIIETPDFPIPEECRHANSFSRGELDATYHDWQILRSDFYAKWDSHPGIPMHVHVVEKFVAQKNNSGFQPTFSKKEPLKTAPLSVEKFEEVPLNISLMEVAKMGVNSEYSHRTTIPCVNLARNKRENYLIEDWFFDKKVLQFTNGILTGKYLYFTDPFYLL